MTRGFLWRGGLVVGACLLWAARLAAFPHPEHVVIVSIDGGKPSVMQRSYMPNLQRLEAEGACTWKASTIYPSITLPSHTSMLTGVGPAKHKIYWNYWKPSGGVVGVPTIFLAAKQAGLSTAMFVGKAKFRHLAQPGALDKFDFNPDQSIGLDEVAPSKRDTDSVTVLAGAVARNAARYIVEHKPDLCFIHLTDPDNAGHKYGWGSPEQIKAFSDVDDAIGIILKALDEAGVARETVMIVTADHGGHGKTHGRNIPDDMIIPWIVWGEGVKRDFAITAAVSTCDTAATALWLLHVPGLPSMDGRPVTSAFEESAGVLGAAGGQ
jgi:predicted AlkP superfamily pyrophosphatase or phosphodiesterase